MKAIALMLSVALVLLSCSETERERAIYETTAPPVDRQFVDVEHAMIASKLDALLNEVKSGNGVIMDMLQPSECEQYDNWAGDWLSDKIIFEGWRHGYRFNANGSYNELDNFGWGWSIHDGGFYAVCDDYTYVITETVVVGAI